VEEAHRRMSGDHFGKIALRISAAGQWSGGL
jgi:hypothetical protein